MENKITLHGPGTYYLAFAAARQESIFHSVFEFEYGVEILSSLNHAHLIAYLLNADTLQIVIDTETDWPDIVDDIHQSFDDMHNRIWHKQKRILSEQVTALRVEESRHLVDLILQLHQLPQRQKWVADASSYPWSSDQYYRTQQAPAWLQRDRMLNLLCHNHHHQPQRYDQVVQNLHPHTLDLQQGNHPDYLALASNSAVQHYLAQPIQTEQEPEDIDLEQSYTQACQLVAQGFSVSSDLFTQVRHRRLFNRLMPVVVWLMQQKGISLYALSQLLKEDEERLTSWLRNIKADHPESILYKLQQRWLVELT